jgi:hypothetical protein
MFIMGPQYEEEYLRCKVKVPRGVIITGNSPQNINLAPSFDKIKFYLLISKLVQGEFFIFAFLKRL